MSHYHSSTALVMIWAEMLVVLVWYQLWLRHTYLKYVTRDYKKIRLIVNYVSVLFFTYFQSLDCLTGQKVEISRFNFFDTDLFRYSAEMQKGNMVLSPASIKSTLAMLLEGANGDTAAEIRNALRLSPDKEEFREQLNEYLSILRVKRITFILIINHCEIYIHL